MAEVSITCIVSLLHSDCVNVMWLDQVFVMNYERMFLCPQLHLCLNHYLSSTTKLYRRN